MNPVLFLFGLIVLSFGELVSYPAFLSYVSRIPPEDKRSIYTGYSFLPLAIAGVTAPIAGGFLYYNIAEGLGMGRLFWGIVASIGLISASAFLHYDKHYNSKKREKHLETVFLIFSELVLILKSYQTFLFSSFQSF